MRALPIVLTAAVVVLLAACGLIPSQGSCDFRPAEPQCEDLLTNPDYQFRATFETLCSVAGGTYSDALCDHTGALGGCRCETCENGESIAWFFPDDRPDAGLDDVAAVQAHCDEQGRPFVEP